MSIATKKCKTRPKITNSKCKMRFLDLSQWTSNLSLRDPERMSSSIPMELHQASRIVTQPELKRTILTKYRVSCKECASTTISPICDEWSWLMLNAWYEPLPWPTNILMNIALINNFFSIIILAIIFRLSLISHSWIQETLLNKKFNQNIFCRGKYKC